jgi:hypothetical protein
MEMPNRVQNAQLLVNHVAIQAVVTHVLKGFIKITKTVCHVHKIVPNVMMLTPAQDVALDFMLME